MRKSSGIVGLLRTTAIMPYRGAAVKRNVFRSQTLLLCWKVASSRGIDIHPHHRSPGPEADMSRNSQEIFVVRRSPRWELLPFWHGVWHYRAPNHAALVPA